MTTKSVKNRVALSILQEGFRLMATAKGLADFYESHFKLVSKYVHATSRGHEAIQLAVGMQLTTKDYAFPYYRDDAMLLGMGLQPYDLMLQLLAKQADPFSGGRTYYSHPSLRRPDFPQIPHQSSATGMQAIPAAGAAMGLQYRELMQLDRWEAGEAPLVVCSLGDASITEGEVAEAFQMAALRQLPIVFLVQDNGWDISAKASEIRSQDASEYAAGFRGLEAVHVDGTDFELCYQVVGDIFEKVRAQRRPFLLHASVPLLNHHTSGVRKEWYRDDLDEHRLRDPLPLLRGMLLDAGIGEATLTETEAAVAAAIAQQFEKAQAADEPSAADLTKHIFAPTALTEEQGERQPAGGELRVMVDCALHAVSELLRDHPECLFYGQDVGGRLGGVFREAATLADKYGHERVFNTPIQEAFIIGSTVGMSAVGLKPIVEVQFADYIWPGLNQLFTEVSRSCYLSNGKWPVSMVLRVPIGAYGSGGPYHSSSVESVLTNIRGIKIVYPSNGADLKGLLKAAYEDPNPVVVLEHKGLYWSKVPGTEQARTAEPAADYRVPIGKARQALAADAAALAEGQSVLAVAYGMGVHWALNAAQQHPGRVEVLDLRSLFPLDEEALFAAARRHGRILVITEEPVNNTFAQSIAARIQENCFEQLDAPVRVVGSENVPAIPLNSLLEQAVLPNAEKIAKALGALLAY